MNHFHHSFSKFLSSSDLIQDSAHCRPCARKYSRSIHQQAPAKTSSWKTGQQGFSNSRTKQDGIPQGPDGFWRCHDTHDTIHSEPMQVDLPCDVPSPLRCVLVRATLWVMCQQLRCQQRSSRIGVDQPWVAVKINHKNPGFCFNWPTWWTVGQTSKKESTKRKLALIRTCYKLNAVQINIECLLRIMIFATSYPQVLFYKVWRSEIASQSRNLPCSWPVFEFVSSIICLHWKMKNKGLHFWKSGNFYHLFSYVMQPHQLQSWGDDSHCERHWIDCWLGWNMYTAPGVQHFEAAKFIQSLLVTFWISCHSQESGLNSKIQSDARDASEQK